MPSQTVPSPPYEERKTWMMSTVRRGGWTLKVYAIEAPGAESPKSLVEHALHFLEPRLPVPSSAEPACGFVILHAGDEALWLLVDLWARDILKHFLYRAPLASPEALESAPADGTAACVWELRVIQHERDAWVRHVLARPSEPDLEAYLADSIVLEAPR